MIKFITLLLLVSCQSNELPVVGLKIKPVYERKLHQWISENPGKTYEQGHDQYPGYLRTESVTIKGQVSLRGDLTSHWRGEKKSFRFSSEKGHFFEGMKEIDFLIPEDKNFELEPVGYEIAAALGLLTPKWKIVEFALNSRSYGPYLMLERWTPESTELRALPEGEIIKEANAWLDVIHLKEQSRYKDVFYSRQTFNPLSLKMEIYRPTFNGIHTPFALEHFSKMLESLSDSLKGRTSQWREFINEDEAVNWTSLMLIMGSYHGILGDNIKWYYHPFDKKFRPIPYDFLPRVLNEKKCPVQEMARMNVWINVWMKDANFRKSLKAKLTELTGSSFLDEILRNTYGKKEIMALNLDGKANERREIILTNKKILNASALNGSCL